MELKKPIRPLYLSEELLRAITEHKIPVDLFCNFLDYISNNKWEQLHRLLGEMNFTQVPCDCASYFAGAEESEWGWVHKDHHFANFMVWCIVALNDLFPDARNYFERFAAETNSAELRKYAQELKDHLFRKNPDPAWVGPTGAVNNEPK